MRNTSVKRDQMGEAIADAEQERQITHYSSNQKILLVGEGNFSFAACLAKQFGSARNMIATSLDSKVSVMEKYAAAKYKLAKFEETGCVMLHEVDVYTMRQHHVLINQLFDRIIYNFPHAGYILREHNDIQIKLHQDLVRGFLASACEMLTETGEIHVTHKTSYPFSQWDIVKLAKEVGLYDYIWLRKHHSEERIIPVTQTKKEVGVTAIGLFQLANVAPTSSPSYPLS